MPKLILSMDGLVLKELVLAKERTTIGRKPDNDIQIDNLAISGQHAVITCILCDAFLEDRNSTNGTYLNGQSVKKQVLQNNDVIELGKYRLKFIADGAAPGAAAEVVDAAALKPFEMSAHDSRCRPGRRPRARPHRRDPDPERRRCWPRAAVDEAAHHARQARSAGRGDHAPAARRTSSPMSKGRPSPSSMAGHSTPALIRSASTTSSSSPGVKMEFFFRS